MNERCEELDPAAHPRAYGSRCVHEIGHIGAHTDAFGEEWGGDDE